MNNHTKTHSQTYWSKSNWNSRVCENCRILCFNIAMLRKRGRKTSQTRLKIKSVEWRGCANSISKFKKSKPKVRCALSHISGKLKPWPGMGRLSVHCFGGFSRSVNNKEFYFVLPDTFQACLACQKV